MILLDRDMRGGKMNIQELSIKKQKHFNFYNDILINVTYRDKHSYKGHTEDCKYTLKQFISWFVSLYFVGGFQGKPTKRFLFGSFLF